MDPITLLTVGLGLGQTIYGSIQNARGKQRARRNIRDDYEVPDEAYKNVGMWEELGQRGLPENSLEFIHQNAIRGLSASLSTGLQLGASANSVNDYYQSYLDKMGDIGVRDAGQRFSNLNNLSNARESLMQQEQTKFGYEDAKWKDEAQLATQEQQQGMQNIMGGIQTGAAGVVQGENRKLYKDQIEANNRALAINPTIDRGTSVASDVYDETSRGTVFGDGMGNRYQYGNVINSSTNPNPVKGPTVPGYVTNYLKQQGLGNNNNSNNEFYWRKMASEGNLFWWTTPGEHK